MNRETGCEFAPEIIKSTRNNFSNEELQTHLQNCADCRETAKIASFFQMNSAKEFAAPKLPTAGLVWWKSKQREKILAGEQIKRTNLIMQAVAAFVALTLIAGLLIYQPAYFSPIASVLDQTFAALEQMAAYLMFIAAAFALIFAVTFFALKRLSANE